MNQYRQVSVNLADNSIYSTKVKARDHRFIADEPESIGGLDFGPTPSELVCAGLGSCVAITIRMYCKRKQWDVGNINVEIEMLKEEVEENGKVVEKVKLLKHISFEKELDEKQEKRLLQIAELCPINKMLKQGVVTMSNLNQL